MEGNGSIHRIKRCKVDPFLALKSLLREIKCCKIEKPYSQPYIRVQYVKKVESKFNQLWFHLYKILSDIEARKISQPTHKIVEERDSLTEYVKKTLKLLNAMSLEAQEKGKTADGEGYTVKTERAESKGDLARVEYMDAFDYTSKERELQDAYHDRNASKYKRIVLTSLGISFDDARNDKKIEEEAAAEKLNNEPKRKKASASGCRSLHHSPVAKHKENDNNVKRAYIEGKAAKMHTAKASNFVAEGKLSDIKIQPIFSDGVLHALDKYEDNKAAGALRYWKEKDNPALLQCLAISAKNRIPDSKAMIEESPRFMKKFQRSKSNLSTLEKIRAHVFGKKKQSMFLNKNIGLANSRPIPNISIVSSIFKRKKAGSACSQYASRETGTSHKSREISSAYSRMAKLEETGIAEKREPNNNRPTTGVALTFRNAHEKLKDAIYTKARRRQLASAPGSRKHSLEARTNAMVEKLFRDCECDKKESDEEFLEAEKLKRAVAKKLRNIQLLALSVVV